MKFKSKHNSVFSSGAWVSDKQTPHFDKKETYVIAIKDLNLDALIGIHPHEKKTKQKILINIILNSPYESKSVNDKIENVVSYEHIVNRIKKLVNSGHIGLLETLAEKVAEICLRDKRVLDARVSIEKLEVFAETKSVGIEIFRQQNFSKVAANKKIFKIKK